MTTNYQEAVENYTSSFTDNGFETKDGAPLPSSKEDPEIIIEDDKPSFSEERNTSPEDTYPEEEAEEGEEESAPSSQSPNQLPRKKKKNSVQQRFDQLTYAIGERDQYNAFLQQQLAEKEALLAAKQNDLNLYQQTLVQKDTESFEHLNDKIKSHEDNIKRELKLALENGDTDTQAEMMAQLADIKAERKALLLQKQHDKQRMQDAAYYADQYSDYSPQEIALPQTFTPPPIIDYEHQEWVKTNPWYEQDAGLRAEADTIASELQRYCLLNNINVSPTDFRNKVASELKLKYGMQPSTPLTESYSSNPSPYIAPVTRGNFPMSNSFNPNGGGHPAGKAPIRLTREQYEFAKTLQPISHSESEASKLRRYAQNIESIPKNEDGIPIYKLRIG
jgi:hypothetical protein